MTTTCQINKYPLLSDLTTNLKSSDIFKCEPCKYETSRRSQYVRHISTNKHQCGLKKVPEYKCNVCSKIYKHQSSLCKHSKQCIQLPTESIQLTNMILEVLKNNNELHKYDQELQKQNQELQKQNQELQKRMLDLCKNGISNAVTNNNQTNKFNINVFLNDQCKDAINFADFIKNIEITHQDLENNAQLGFVSGISKILMDNLKQLGVNERPIHCTDIKRETMYIKDENKWTKEVDDSKLQKAIQTVSCKSMGKLQEWKKENPDYQDMDSVFSQKCLDIHKHTIAGSDREVYYPKVIHALARETMVVRELREPAVPRTPPFSGNQVREGFGEL